MMHDLDREHAGSGAAALRFVPRRAPFDSAARGRSAAFRQLFRRRAAQKVVLPGNLPCLASSSAFPMPTAAPKLVTALFLALGANVSAAVPPTPEAYATQLAKNLESVASAKSAAPARAADILAVGGASHLKVMTFYGGTADQLHDIGVNTLRSDAASCANKTITSTWGMKVLLELPRTIFNRNKHTVYTNWSAEVDKFVASAKPLVAAGTAVGVFVSFTSPFLPRQRTVSLMPPSCCTVSLCTDGRRDRVRWNPPQILGRSLSRAQEGAARGLDLHSTPYSPIALILHVFE